MDRMGVPGVQSERPDSTVAPPSPITLQLVLIVGGMVVWFGAAFIATGFSAVWAFVLNLIVLVAVLGVTSITRTARIQLVGVAYFAGGLATTVMYGVATVYSQVDRGSNSNLRALVLPPLEEALKLAPVLGLLWWMRRRTTWTLGAADLMLLGVASAAGFASVEDAFIRNNFGWDALPWLPVAVTTREGVIGGHVVWTGVAAGFLGLALLIRRVPVAALTLCAVGAGVAILSHVANNYGLGDLRGNTVRDLLHTFDMRGWLSVVLFPLLLAVVVVADLVASPRVRTDADRAPPVIRAAPPLDRWGYELDRRALHFARFQLQGANEATRWTIAPVVDGASLLLWDRQNRLLRSATRTPSPVVPLVTILVLVCGGAIVGLALEQLTSWTAFMALLPDWLRDVGSQVGGSAPLGGAGAGGAAAGTGGLGAPGGGDGGSQGPSGPTGDPDPC